MEQNNHFKTLNLCNPNPYMSPIVGLIITPNLKIFLSSSKLKLSSSKWMSQTVLQKTQSGIHITRLNLLMHESIVHSKIQIMTHYCPRCSSSHYLLQVQVHAQKRYSNVLTTKMITNWQTIFQQFILSESS